MDAADKCKHLLRLARAAGTWQGKGLTKKLLEDAYAAAVTERDPELLVMTSMNLGLELLHNCRHGQQPDGTGCDWTRIESLFVDAAACCVTTAQPGRQGLALLYQAVTIDESPERKKTLEARERSGLVCQLCERALELQGDEFTATYVAQAHHLLGTHYTQINRPLEAVAHFKEEMELCERLALWEEGCNARYRLALAVQLDHTRDPRAKSLDITALLEPVLTRPCSISLKVLCLRVMVSQAQSLPQVDTLREQASLQRIHGGMTRVQAEIGASSDLGEAVRAMWTLTKAEAYFHLGRTTASSDFAKSLDAAAAHYWRAAQLFAAAADDLKEEESLSGLLFSTGFMSDTNSILRWHERAITALEALDRRQEQEVGPAAMDHPFVQFRRGRIAAAKAGQARVRGDTTAALAYYGEALHFAALSEPHFLIGASRLTLANRGELLMQQGRWDEAYQDFKRVIDLDAEVQKPASRLAPQEEITVWEGWLATHSDFFQKPYSRMAVVCANLKRPAEAFSYSERGRGTVIRREMDGDTQHAAWQSAPDLDQLRSSTVMDEQTALLQYMVGDQGSLVFLVTNSGIEAFPLPKEQDAAMKSLIRGEVGDSGDTLRDRFDAFADGHFDAFVMCLEGLDELGRRTFDLLLSPVWEALGRGGITHIILSGNLGLERLPWCSVPVPSEQEFFSRQFVLSKIPSAAVLIHTGKTAPAGLQRVAALVGAHPDLPFITIEQRLVVEALRTHSGASVEFGVCTNREALLEAIAGRSHLHIGCHGHFDEANPLQTRLILDSRADTGMTLRDLISSKNSRPLPGFGLVLSACSVGLLRPDRGGNQLGLATAFLLAGARYVIAALWPVEDLATAFLMSRFYMELGDRPNDAARCLQQAQSWLCSQTGGALADELQRWRHLEGLPLTQRLNLVSREKTFRISPTQHPYAHPYWWAGFELTGLR